FDDTNGGLSHSVAVADNKRIVFDNTYLSSPSAPITLSGTKELDGRALVDGEFTFELHEADSNFNIIPNKDPVATATNKNGTFSMSLSYKHGEDYTHYYVLSEHIAPERKGVHYDTREYHITVMVIDDGLGQMFASVQRITATGTQHTFNPNQLSFVNSYSPASKTISLPATKELIRKVLAADAYEFEVVDSTGSIIATGKNDENGDILFSDIVIEKAGTYEWTVREVNGGKTIDNVDYDKSVYTVKVVIKDDLIGNLVIEDASLLKDGKKADKIHFVNVYNEPIPEPTPPTPVPPTTATPTPAPDTSDTSPKTNDTSLFSMWIALMFVSGGGIAGVALFGKKEQAEE
ncbi:MAG: hypothetical protein J6I80_01640, partial [Clostridia bacterium]|nr:hypothetical protein [Clostridia bacterium]